MKFQLIEDHQVRLSDKILKAGIYTLEELEAAYAHDSLQWCIKNTTLGSKLTTFIENELEETKTKKNK